jgi:CheY-like chemotaxis protein
VTRVLLVDDERLVCAHLRAVLEAGGVEVAGEAYDGAEAVELAVRLRPDVVLLDLRMPGVDGLTALDRLVRLSPAPRVVVLTTFDHDEHVLRALRAGATGFLLKTTEPADLVDLVRVAAEGHTVLSPAAAQRLVTANDAGAHRAPVGAGGGGAGGARRGSVERPDLGAAARVGGDGEGPRLQGDGEARLREPHAGGAAGAGRRLRPLTRRSSAGHDFRRVSRIRGAA